MPKSLTKDEKEVIEIISSKVKEMRITSMLSLQELANKINVSHQQLVKYEDGSNTISIQRLVSISKALKVPPSFFFEDMDKKSDIGGDLRLSLEMIRNFGKIKNKRIKKALNKMLKSIASSL